MRSRLMENRINILQGINVQCRVITMNPISLYVYVGAMYADTTYGKARIKVSI